MIVSRTRLSTNETLLSVSGWDAYIVHVKQANYLVWGACGAVLVATLVVVGKMLGAEFPEGNVALSNPWSAAVAGFGWGAIVCFVRNWLSSRRVR